MEAETANDHRSNVVQQQTYSGQIWTGPESYIIARLTKLYSVNKKGTIVSLRGAITVRFTALCSVQHSV